LTSELSVLKVDNIGGKTHSTPPTWRLQLPSSIHYRLFTTSVMHSAEFWVYVQRCCISWCRLILAAIVQQLSSAMSDGEMRTTATAMWKISSLCSPNSDHSNLSCIILLCVAQFVLTRRFRKKSFILNARFIFNRKLAARQLCCCNQKITAMRIRICVNRW
jgi:hypothetical protein